MCWCCHFSHKYPLYWNFFLLLIHSSASLYWPKPASCSYAFAWATIVDKISWRTALNMCFKVLVLPENVLFLRPLPTPPFQCWIFHKEKSPWVKSDWRYKFCCYWQHWNGGKGGRSGKTVDRANDFVNDCSTSCNIEFRIQQGVGSKVSYLYEKCCDWASSACVAQWARWVDFKTFEVKPDRARLVTGCVAWMWVSKCSVISVGQRMEGDKVRGKVEKVEKGECK